MRLRLLVCVFAAATACVLIGAPARASTPLIVQDAVWAAKLTGSSAYPAVRGNVEILLTPDTRTIKVNLSRATRLSGRRLMVYVGGRLTGLMRVGSRGRAHLDGPLAPRRLRIGHYRVAVRTRRGVLVASGRLRLVSPH